MVISLGFSSASDSLCDLEPVTSHLDFSYPPSLQNQTSTSSSTSSSSPTSPHHHHHHHHHHRHYHHHQHHHCHHHHHYHHHQHHHCHHLHHPLIIITIITIIRVTFDDELSVCVRQLPPHDHSEGIPLTDPILQMRNWDSRGFRNPGIAAESGTFCFPLHCLSWKLFSATMGRKHFKRKNQSDSTTQDKSHVTHWYSRGANPSINIQVCVVCSVLWDEVLRDQSLYVNWKLNPVQNRLANNWILVWVVHPYVHLQRLNCCFFSFHLITLKTSRTKWKLLCIITSQSSTFISYHSLHPMPTSCFFINGSSSLWNSNWAQALCQALC